MTTLIPKIALNGQASIIGTTRSGKTHTSRWMLEWLWRAMKKPRAVIVDPKGDWWGARLAADGKGKGMPFTIIGGPHADPGLRIDGENAARMAGAVGRMIATTDSQILLDVSDFDVKQMRDYVTRILKEIYHLNRTPLWLIVDEADEFAPKTNMAEGGGIVLSAMQRIAKRGLGRGIRLWSITQRPASLHNDILAMAQTVIAMRLTLPHDRDAFAGWIRDQPMPPGIDAKQVLASLASLPVGTGWAWCSPEQFLEKVKFPHIETFDSMKTPEIGESKEFVLPPLETRKIAAELDKAIEDAKASDPEALRAKIKMLEAEIKKKAPKVSLPAQVKTVTIAAPRIDVDALVKSAVDRTRVQVRKGITPLLREMSKTANYIAERAAKQTEDIASFARQIGSLHTLLDADIKVDVPTPKPIKDPPTVMTKSIHVPPPPPSVMAHLNGPSKKTSPGQRIINALADFALLGLEQVDRVPLAYWAGLSPASGHTDNTLGETKREGLIDYPAPGKVCLTPAGSSRAASSTMPSQEALAERIRAVMTEPQWRIWSALPADGTPMTRPDLGAAAGFSSESGHFDNTVGEVKRLKAIHYPSRGLVARAPQLLEGIP